MRCILGSGLPATQCPAPTAAISISDPVAAQRSASHRQLPFHLHLSRLPSHPRPRRPRQISRRQRHPDRRAAPLVVPGRRQLQPNSRPSAAFGGAGALVPGPTGPSQTKKKIGDVQLSEIRTAGRAAALHPPPGPTDAAPAIAKSEQRPPRRLRLRPRPHHRVPQQQPSCCRQSPVTRPVSLASHTLLHAPATPSPPPPRLSTPESIEPTTRHHPASSPTPPTIAPNRDPDPHPAP